MATPRHEPSFDEFRELARHGNVVPVYRTLLADTLTPVSAYEKFARGDYSYLLESASGGEKIARYSFLGSDPFMLFKARGDAVEIARDGAMRTFTSTDPIESLRHEIEQFKAVQVPNLPRFYGGAVGYAAYDAVRYVEHLPNAPKDNLGLPDLYFAFYDLMIVFDHLNKTLLVICSARVGGRDPKIAYEEAIQRIDAAVERLRTPVTKLTDDITPAGEITLPFTSNFSKEDF